MEDLPPNNLTIRLERTTDSEEDNVLDCLAGPQADYVGAVKQVQLVADGMGHGILSAWSYAGLQSPNPPSIIRRPRRLQLVPGRFMERNSSSSSPEMGISRQQIYSNWSETQHDATTEMPIPNYSKMRTSPRAQALKTTNVTVAENEQVNDGVPLKKKSRGRPHLGLSPETTAERRRAQVRIAQRAYRVRREATVSSLEERNRHLEKVMDGMTESFLSLQSAAMKLSNIEKSPEIANQLQKSTQEFLAFARSAYEDRNEDSEAD